MIPSPAHLLRQLRRERTVRRIQASQDDLANRPQYDLDPTGRLNRLLDTDLGTAVAHPNLSVVAPAVDVLAEVTRRIDALHAAGSLDYGSFAVLDRLLEAWGVTMCDAATAHTQSTQLNFLNRAALQEARTVQETWDALQHSQEQLDDAEDARQQARSILTGTTARPRATRNAAPLAPMAIPIPGTAQEMHTRTPAAPAQPSAGLPLPVEAANPHENPQSRHEVNVVDTGEGQPSSQTFPLRSAEQDTEERAEGAA